MRNNAFIGRGWLFYTGALPAASPHRHHAIQFIMARRGTLVVTDRFGVSASGSGAIIPADTWHATPRAISSAFLLYVDRETQVGRQFRKTTDADAATWIESGRKLGGLRGSPEPTTEIDACALAREIVREGFGRDAEAATGAPPHPSIAAVIEFLEVRLADPDRLPNAGELAHLSGLSERHFSRVFNRDVGLSLPAYLRWLRLRRVADFLAEGATLTQAAHNAGFSDSAHMSRVFHASFGMTPSLLMSDIRICTCDLSL